MEESKKDLKQMTPVEIDAFIKSMIRRMIITNQTDQEIKLTLEYKTEASNSTKEDVTVGPKSKGAIPFFVDGICTITVDDAVMVIEMNEPLKDHELVLAYDKDMAEHEESNTVESL